MNTTKALILLASRPESVQVAVGRLRPEAVGVIVSQEILPAVAAKCSELGEGVRFLYRIVDSPMEISDASRSWKIPVGTEHATLRGGL